MLYTAHVGDCRAVLLGTAPPRTIKVPPGGHLGTGDHSDTTDDESSYHSSDETEILSSSDHEAQSSDEEDLHKDGPVPVGVAVGAVSSPAPATTTAPYLNYMRRPSRRPRRTTRDVHTPFVALPPLLPARAVGLVGNNDNVVGGNSGGTVDASGTTTAAGAAASTSTTVVAGTSTRPFTGESDHSDGLGSTSVSTVENLGGTTKLAPGPVVVSTDGESQIATLPQALELAPFTRPIDLTTDHSAYNPTEVSAVLKRCNNAPKAISAGVGGGIKRVAGSLAVTRAFGDAYLKTPMLSFHPYKPHAPYITAQPEVNCRLLTKDGDRALIVASDGVWERCNGEDILRWVRNYSVERKADMERRQRGWRGGVLPNDKTPTDTIQSDSNSDDSSNNYSPLPKVDYDTDASVGQKRDRAVPPGTSSSVVVAAATGTAAAAVGAAADAKKRKLTNRPGGRRRKHSSIPPTSNVADVVVRRVLNKVRRARNMASLSDLMDLPKGRARRSKHDDITASVIDLRGFVS